MVEGSRKVVDLQTMRMMRLGLTYNDVHFNSYLIKGDSTTTTTKLVIIIIILDPPSLFPIKPNP